MAGNFTPGEKETVERSFADAKELHGHRYARFRGIDNVREQCLLEAACQNMKKIAQTLARKAKRANDAVFFRGCMRLAGSDRRHCRARSGIKHTDRSSLI